MKTYLKDLTLEEIIKRLKNGEIIKNERNEDTIKYYDCMLCRLYKDGTYLIGATLTSDSMYLYYFETEESFEIKETGFYKTKDGRKVFVSRIEDSDNPYNVSGIIQGDYMAKSWTIEGRINRNYEDNEDIISKWED